MKPLVKNPRNMNKVFKALLIAIGIFLFLVIMWAIP